MKICELSVIWHMAAAYTASVLPRKPFKKTEEAAFLSLSETVRSKESLVKREIKSVVFKTNRQQNYKSKQKTLEGFETLPALMRCNEKIITKVRLLCFVQKSSIEEISNAKRYRSESTSKEE